MNDKSLQEALAAQTGQLYVHVKSDTEKLIELQEKYIKLADKYNALADKYIKRLGG